MLDPRKQRQLQRLMQNSDWSAVEEFLSSFMLENFIKGSAKRETEFETMWYLAFNEGGKYFINKFITELENEAHEAE